MHGWRRIDTALALALAAAAALLRWGLLAAPAYGDEGLHYWTARHLGDELDAVTDLWGNDLAGAPHLVLQRPLFYLLFAPAAQFGFPAFRAAVSLATCLLPSLAYGLARSHAASRPAAVLAGAAVAAFPAVVLWSNLALMDAAMTGWLLAALWARSARRPRTAAALALAAMWSKETAIPLVALWVVFEVAAARRASRSGTGDPRQAVSLLPLRLPVQASALLWACVLGAVPVLAFQSLDLVRIGAQTAEPTAGVLDRLLGTPWLAAFVALGLVLPASRFLAGAVLAVVAFNLAWHGTGHGVPGWYNVASTVLALVTTAVAADAWLKRCWRAPPGGSRPKAALAGLAPMALALLIVGSAILTPPGPGRGWLQPLAGDGGDSLPTLQRFETTIRDQDYVAATRHANDTTRAVVAVDIYPPRLLVPFEAQAGRIVLVWTPLHEVVPFGFAEVAAAVEAPGTLTVVEVGATRLNQALRATYADCRVEASAAYEAFAAAACTGRAEALEAAWRAAATMAAP